MGYVRFDSDWRYHGCQVLRLESDLLCIDVLPELGGKVYRWVYKPEDRDWLWQHPRTRPTIVSPGVCYDDSFCGGWDELFPTTAPCQHAGEAYPDHGEFWTRRCDWDIDRAGDAITLHLSAGGPVTPTRMERWITLTASSPVVRFKNRLTHLGEHGFDFLWTLHPALAVGPASELVIPAGRGVIAYPGQGRLADEPLEFTWPDVPGREGRMVDMSKIPPRTDAPGFDMVYLTELREGWFAHLDRATGSGFGLAFDHTFFRAISLFQTHGGWRGLHTAIVEPTVGYPENLADAAAAGRARRLESGQIIDTEMTAVVFTNRDGIARIARDGTVT